MEKYTLIDSSQDKKRKPEKAVSIMLQSSSLSMIFLSKTYCLLALLIILSLLGCDNNGFNEHSEKPVISVGWGAKAGKFGLAIPDEGEIVGPRTFNIDDNGYIHIFDSIKKNIKVFNGEGIFQKSIGSDLPGYSFVVYRGNYYLLDGESIYKYTLSGIPVETYPIAPEITLYEGYGQWMRIDGYGDLYIRSKGKAYKILKGIGRQNTVLSGEEQFKSERGGTPDKSGSFWFTIAKDNIKRFKLCVHAKNGSFINEFPIETEDIFGSVIFLDQDEKGIIYLETKRIGTNGVTHLEIRRYRRNGRLIQSIELPNKYYTTIYKKIIIDKKGDIYQLQTTPSGVKIIKWNKL
ncbi:MAG: hypothetical protein KKC46_03575 [Proteobacteria bacterium]|nr:hypothetical protein [Pseudomonadota bacterium]